MSGPPDPVARGADACRAALEGALHGGALPALDDVSRGSLLDEVLRDPRLRQHGAAAAPLVRRLADTATPKAARKVARRALYRLGQAGVDVPPATPRPRPRCRARARARDPRRGSPASTAAARARPGSSSRVGWAASLRLCSLILNDEAGILEVAGGPDHAAAGSTPSWLAWQRARSCRGSTAARPAAHLVAEALALHERAGTSPPRSSQRFRPLFEGVAPPPSRPERRRSCRPALPRARGRCSRCPS